MDEVHPPWNTHVGRGNDTSSSMNHHAMPRPSTLIHGVRHSHGWCKTLDVAISTEEVVKEKEATREEGKR